MPEFKVGEKQINSGELLNYPGDNVLSEWLKKNRFPISTNDDVIFYKKNLASAIDHTSVADRESLDNIMRGNVPKEVFFQKAYLEKFLVKPIENFFTSMIGEYNEYQTFPLQIRSWINNPSPEVSCQMPTIFLKLILDKGQIPSHIRVRTDAAHPFLMVEGNGKYFAMDYYDRGGRVREIGKDSWENRLTFRDQAFLIDPLSAMRFLDYGNALIELFKMLDSSGHGSSGQVENMNLISKLSDQMESEFGSTEELSRYYEMTREVHWRDK